ncbi:1857_t:CDS:2, partial [Racocetra persica]
MESSSSSQVRYQENDMNPSYFLFLKNFQGQDPFSFENQQDLYEGATGAYHETYQVNQQQQNLYQGTYSPLQVHQRHQ